MTTGQVMQVVPGQLTLDQLYAVFPAPLQGGA